MCKDHLNRSQTRSSVVCRDHLVNPGSPQPMPQHDPARSGAVLLTDEVFQKRIVVMSASMALGVLNVAGENSVRNKDIHPACIISGWMTVTWKREQHTEICEYTQLLQNTCRWSQNGGGHADDSPSTMAGCS